MNKKKTVYETHTNTHTYTQYSKSHKTHTNWSVSRVTVWRIMPKTTTTKTVGKKNKCVMWNVCNVEIATQTMTETFQNAQSTIRIKETKTNTFKSVLSSKYMTGFIANMMILTMASLLTTTSHWEKKRPFIIIYYSYLSDVRAFCLVWYQQWMPYMGDGRASKPTGMSWNITALVCFPPTWPKSYDAVVA